MLKVSYAPLHSRSANNTIFALPSNAMQLQSDELSPSFPRRPRQPFNNLFLHTFSLPILLRTEQVCVVLVSLNSFSANRINIATSFSKSSGALCFCSYRTVPACCSNMLFLSIFLVVCRNWFHGSSTFRHELRVYYLLKNTHSMNGNIRLPVLYHSDRRR